MKNVVDFEDDEVCVLVIVVSKFLKIFLVKIMIGFVMIADDGAVRWTVVVVVVDGGMTW